MDRACQSCRPGAHAGNADVFCITHLERTPGARARLPVWGVRVQGLMCRPQNSFWWTVRPIGKADVKIWEARKFIYNIKFRIFMKTISYRQFCFLMKLRRKIFQIQLWSSYTVLIIITKIFVKYGIFLIKCWNYDMRV